MDNKLIYMQKYPLFQAPNLDDQVDFHFIAFVEKDGILYDLDGRKPAPVDCGPTSKETFLRVSFFTFYAYINEFLRNNN